MAEPGRLLGKVLSRALSRFVPRHEPPAEEQLAALRRQLQLVPRLTVITGAGVSTESGVPDYRSEEVGLYARSNHRPVQYQQFIDSAVVRRRYWARNFVGWPRFSAVRPNATHEALAAGQRSDRVSALVTQNVDQLHQRAGSCDVTELHGSAHHVGCLRCSYRSHRRPFQQVLAQANPTVVLSALEIRPDGDVQLDEDVVDSFVVPPCPECGGPLKPDIVFFGDSVPKQRVQHVRQCVERTDALLVAGSSLQVYSAYRFVLHAVELGRPVYVVNIGPTRADHLTTLKLSARAGLVLPRLGLDQEAGH